MPKRRHKSTQKVGGRSALVGVQDAQNVLLPHEQIAEGVVRRHRGPSGGGGRGRRGDRGDPGAAHQPAGGQPIDAIGHGAGSGERLLDQLPRRQLVRRALTAQRRQDVELPDVQAMGGEGLLAGEIEVSRQARHARQDAQRLTSRSGASRSHACRMRSTSSMSPLSTSRF